MRPAHTLHDRLGYAAGLMAAVLLLLIVPAPSAAAHSVGGESASNYRTTVIGLRPAAGDEQAAPDLTAVDAAVDLAVDALDAVDLGAVENGSRLRLEVRGNHTVLVGGYEDDFYLRLDPTGVWENTRSSAAYLNDDRTGTAAPPPGVVDPDAAPVWERIAAPAGDTVVALWHDHRAHWMSRTAPPMVRASPGTPHRIYDWSLPLTVDGVRVDAYGTLDWVPGPSPMPWVVLAVGAGVAVAACGLLRRRWGRGLALAAVGAVGADVAHAALAAAGAAEDPLGAFLWGNSVRALVWAAGLVAAGLLLRRSVTGRYLAASAGLVLALVGGFADVGVLYHSGAPVAGPLDLTRALTAITIGLGLGLVAAVSLVGRGRRDPSPPEAFDASRISDFTDVGGAAPGMVAGRGAAPAGAEPTGQLTGQGSADLRGETPL